MENEKPTALGVYTNASGFSAGMREHLDIRAHIGDGLFGYTTTVHNFPDIPYFIRNKAHDDEYGDLPYHRLSAEDLDVVYCAPSCAPWSVAGTRRGINVDEDPRVKKVDWALEAGMVLEPKIWMMESLTRLPTSSPEKVQLLEDFWTSKGYAVTHFYTNYLVHGLPQNRRRWHFIAHRIELTDPLKVLPGGKFPTRMPTASDVWPQDYVARPEEYIHVASFERWKWFLPEVPVGYRMRNAYRVMAGFNRDEWGGPAWSAFKVDPDSYVLAIIGNPGVMCHYEEPRLLTLKELMALCGYPEDYEIVAKSEAAKAIQLGRGVLPPMGRFLSEWFAKSVRLDWPVKKAEITTVDWVPIGSKLVSQRVKPDLPPFGSRPELKRAFTEQKDKSITTAVARARELSGV